MVGGEISQPRDFFHCHRYRIEEIAAENETYNGTHVIQFWRQEARHQDA